MGILLSAFDILALLNTELRKYATLPYAFSHIAARTIMPYTDFKARPGLGAPEITSESEVLFEPGIENHS